LFAALERLDDMPRQTARAELAGDVPGYLGKETHLERPGNERARARAADRESLARELEVTGHEVRIDRERRRAGAALGLAHASPAISPVVASRSSSCA
jgi:hypothetical protein